MNRARRKTVPLLIVGAPLLFLILFTVWGERQVERARLNHLLIDAVRNNEVAALTAALKRGADPNARDVGEKPLTWRDLVAGWLHHSLALHGDTALLLAAQQENAKDVATQLIEAGANVNAANADGKTPLVAAVEQGHVDLMRDLLNHGANPNARIDDVQGDGKQSTILIRTITSINGPVYGNTTCRDLVKLLLEHGADVHTLDSDGSTALLTAIGYDKPEVAMQLMDRGVDINRADNDGDTPLHMSSYGPDDKIMDALLQRGVNVAPAHNAGWSLLAWAAENDNGKVLQTALSRGISANYRDKRGRTALMFAAASGNAGIVKTLLAHGATVDMRDHLGWTALMFAAQNDAPAVIRTLLEHGADPQLRDEEDHWTAAQRARSRGQEQIARMLLSDHMALAGAIEIESSDRSRAYKWEAIVDSPHMSVPLSGGARMNLGVTEPRANGDRDCKATIVDGAGRAGKPLIMPFFFMPEVRVFSDTDGRRYACFSGHHRAESIYLAALHGCNMVMLWQPDPHEMEGANCQPLPGGGALITRGRRNRDMESIPARHEGDGFTEVFRFRNGKVTHLGLIVIPQQ